jgi:hypothetical protein
MTNIIADLAVEVEAAAWLAFHFVHALEKFALGLASPYPVDLFSRFNTVYQPP